MGWDDDPYGRDALDRHDDDVLRRRQDDIDAVAESSLEGNPGYRLTIEQRLEALRDYFERHDTAMAIAHADKILAMNPTAEQRAEALRLRRRAEREAEVFPDLPITRPPVEPTWPF